MLFVICWSGTFAVFSHELDWLVTPALRVQPQPERASWGAIKQSGREALPGTEISSLQAPLNARAAATVWMQEPGSGVRLVWVDPYTARVTGVTEGRYTIQRFFRSFHYALFLPEVGIYLVTAFGLTLLVSLAAALNFYKRWWTRFFRFKPGKGCALWSELHKAAGLWSLWFVLVITLTSVWYLFEAGRLDFGDGKVRYALNGEAGIVQIPAPASDAQSPALPLDALIEKVKRRWPEFQPGWISYDWPVEGAVSIEGRAGFPLVRDRANQTHLDARNGEVLLQYAWNELPPYWIWSNMADPLHFGDFAGLWSKAIWFIFGLLLSALILTGTYLHIQRLNRHGDGRHRWPGTGAALVVSLGVLAATVPFGFHEARELYGPTVDGVKQLPTLAPGVKAVIIGWVALTLALIAGWVLLLWRPGLVRFRGFRGQFT